MVSQSVNFLNKPAGGISCYKRDDFHASATGQHAFCAYDAVDRVITAFYQYIRLYGFDELSWRVFVEKTYRIDDQQRGERKQAVFLAVYRTLRSLKPVN